MPLPVGIIGAFAHYYWSKSDITVQTMRSIVAFNELMGFERCFTIDLSTTNSKVLIYSLAAELLLYTLVIIGLSCKIVQRWNQLSNMKVSSQKSDKAQKQQTQLIRSTFAQACLERFNGIELILGIYTNPKLNMSLCSCGFFYDF